MLDPWIIDEIRRREEEERQREERPVLELPLDQPMYRGPGQGGKPADDSGSERGVTIIQIG